MPDPRGWGLRTDMMEHAVNLKKALDKRANGQANFVIAGDLNTMGLNVRDGDNDIDGEAELDRLERRFLRVGMSLKSKDETATWWNGGSRLGPSDLDHVLAAEQLDIRAKGQSQVNVLGWPQQNTAASKRRWIEGLF